MKRLLVFLILLVGCESAPEPSETPLSKKILGAWRAEDYVFTHTFMDTGFWYLENMQTGKRTLGAYYVDDVEALLHRDGRTDELAIPKLDLMYIRQNDSTYIFWRIP